MIKEAIILAGGLGTRLQQVVSDVPKPMAPVNGRPFLEYIFRYLKHYSIQKMVLSVGFKAESIREHFGERFDGIDIDYAFEHEPLGTGGAVKLALDHCKADTVLVLNGDTLFNVDLTGLYKAHHAAQADISMCLRHLPDVSRYGTVTISDAHQVTGFAEKQAASGAGYINGGIYLLKRNIFDTQNLPEKFSLEKDFFEKAYLKLKIFGFISDGYFIDIGIPEDYERAQKELTDYAFR